MENYLYLLEIFVETITFSSIIGVAKASEVIVSGEVGKFLKMDIFSMRQDDNAVVKQIDLNCGKSNLFSCGNDELLQKLMQYPLILTVTVRGNLKGRTIIKWDKQFFDLIHHSPESFGVIGPVNMQDKYILKEKDTEAIMGDMKAVIRLSSFGTSIQTSYQLVQAERGTNKKFLIRGARGETTFECQKVSGSSSEILPVTPLFTTGTGQTRSKETPSKYEDERVSWMALYKSTLDPKFSVPPEDFTITLSNVFHPIKTPSSLTFDIVSIMERPDEHKFIDLRIRKGSGGFIFELDANERNIEETDFSKESYIEQEEEEEGFTAKNINRMLCKNKDCPAVKKFKEFGLGPLAKVHGLGTLKGDVLPPTTYGISQMYGVFDQYGPYGLFSRPKNPDNRFVAKQDDNWAALCWKPRRKKENKLNKSTDNCPCGHYPPLRLTGGGVLDYDDVKSPLHECKEVMDQFDEVLSKYKKAIGPCGKPTCPFAQNVINETCKKICQHPEKKADKKETQQFTLSSPPTTPTSETSSKKHTLKGACGSPKCAYAKYKSQLVDEDAIMELQYLSSATSGRCGHPKCPFPVEPELPPIHWDCPDPLPKGRCKNPECPYLPKEIKCLNAVLAKGPCGNLNCPYSVPDACPSPNCPFSSKECPYQPQQQQQQKQKQVRGVSSLCENPNCPFASKDTNSLCDNPDCPYADKGSINKSLCDNPNCPYASKEADSICDNPDCPYASKEADSICDNPECPFATKKPSPCYLPQEEDVCDNPNCPFAKQSPCYEPCYTPPCGVAPCYSPPCGVPPCYTPSCGVPPCYTRPCGTSPCAASPNLLSMCANSNNPYLALLAYYLGMSPCDPEYKKICFGGPECPFQKEKETTSKGGSNVCSSKSGQNRDECLDESPDVCPYTPGQNGDECLNSNPDVCPYTPGGKAKKKLSPCDIPQKSEEKCANPSCPYERQSKGEGDASSVCRSGGSVCSTGKEPKTKLCYKKPSPCYIPKDDVCDNPDCPFAPNPCFPLSCGGLPCSLGMNPLLQAMLTYYLPSLCNDVNCPYTAQEVQQFKNIFQMMFGAIECPRRREPSIIEEKNVKGDDICGNPSCPYRQDDAEDTNNLQCTDDTCQSHGGNLVCAECPTDAEHISYTEETCKSPESPIDEEIDNLTEGAVEYKTDTRTDIDMAPCTAQTCQSTGGKLICDVCPCSSDKTQERSSPKKPKVTGKKGKQKGKYVYSIGDKYPGVQIGHKECVLPYLNVPKRMGWLWNVHTPYNRMKPRRGWRPGAIARTIAARIRKHREAQGLQMLELRDPRKGRKGYGEYESATSVHVAPKPTLQIKKRDGCYWITMNPLKDPHTLVENESPYMDCTPMQFKIVKNKEKKEENDEYRSCFCGDDQSAESSSSDSELDIEFTPPAGIIHPERFKKKRNVVHGSTQYLASDFEKKSEKGGKKDKKGKKGKDKKGGKGKKGKGKKK